MRKKYKLLLLLISLTLLTGCTFKYDVKIMLDGKVLESADLFDGETTAENKKEFLSVVDKNLKIINLNVDDKKLIYDGNFIGVNLQKSYSNLQTYARQSKTISYLFESVVVKEKDKIVEVSSVPTQYDIIQQEQNGLYNYTDSEIVLTLPFKVLSSNANEVDSVNNKYIWTINEDFKEIKIRYDKSQYYTKNIFKLFSYMTVDVWLTLLLIVVIVWFVISVLILGLRLLKREKK